MSTRWQDLADDEQVAGYDRRMADNLEQVRTAGGSVHAEADLVARLVPAGSGVLDAGCGTGRITWPLADLGYRVTGVDNDPRMLEIARRRTGPADSPEPTWVQADVTTYHGAPVDLVLAAGNLLPLLAQGSLPDAVRSLTALLEPGGLLLAGYGLDSEHLPGGCPVTPLDAIERAYADAGLSLRARWGTWEGGPFTGEYAVDVLLRGL
ncbi:MAG: class I SAM-dependent methyltransferase [Ornithinimicrobium sp.]|uniref:class I SAM-dependent methyltransferase n=1 Tax=Ornithinimicrobium sp. TaxID=1977084 RepID=UPI003D9BF71A